MLWWHWLVVGLVLVALEMAASGGFYVIFFGIAALAIAGLHAIDLAGPVWVQLALFSLISVGSLVAAGAQHSTLSTTLGFIAVTCATTNVVGGFIITDRMLRMFKKKRTVAPEEEKS